MVIKKNKDLLMLSLLTILSIGHFFSISILNYFITLLVILLFIFSTYEECSIIIFQLLPFFNLLNGKIGQTSFYYLIIVTFICKHIIYKEYKLSSKKIALFLILAILRLLCGNVEVFIKWLILFSIVIITYDNKVFYENIEEIVNKFDLALIFSSIVGYIMLISGRSIYTGGYVYSKALGNVTRFAGLIGDPVFYSQVCAIAICLTLVIMYNKKIKLINICTLLSLIALMILSYSKTGIIMVIISIFCYLICEIFNNIKSKKKFIKALCLIVLGIISIFASINYVEKSNNYIISNYVTRFKSKDLLTGRRKISDYYIHLLKSKTQSIFIGISDKDYTTPFYINSEQSFNRSHNIFIETVAIFGLIPTIFILIIILKIIIKAIIIKKYNIINVMPLFILFLSGFTLHGHYEFHYYLILSICLIILFYNRRKGNIKNERF